MKELLLLLSLVGIITLADGASADPRVSLQVFEIKFDDFGGVMLSHDSTLVRTEGWSGEVVFTYAFGIEEIFESPEELLNWESKILIQTEGCESSSSFDFMNEKTTVTLEIFNSSSEVGITVHVNLINMVEKVRANSIPLLIGGGERRRFSFVTARSSLDINKTRVIVHMPEDQVVSNYLPIQNITILPQGSMGQSIFWIFGGEGAKEARVYVEFGPKGKIGLLMVLIIVVIILGIVLVTLKLVLTLYEESLTY